MKIIVVHRPDSSRDITGVLLKSFGHDIAFAEAISDSLALIKKENPDLILIDRELKDDDGLELSKIIKSDFLTAYIPIIMLIDRRQMRKDLLEIEQGIDDYIVKPPDPIDLQVRIEMAVRRAVHQCFANALTRLPGNRMIEIVLERMIKAQEKFTFGYIDIDKFKYFNDTYGYLRGDYVIIQTAHILSRVVKEKGSSSDFVGHIGGDDFVFIIHPEKEKEIVLSIIKEFDRLIPYHYSKEDRQKGYIEVEDRMGKKNRMPLMSLSVALIDNHELEIKSAVELSETAFEIKRYLKTMPGSKFLKNRRIKNDGLLKRAREAARVKKQIQEVERLNMGKPLGQLLLEAAIINEAILDEALMKHWRTGQSIGHILTRMGVVNEETIVDILKNTPVSVKT